MSVTIAHSSGKAYFKEKLLEEGVVGWTDRPHTYKAPPGPLGGAKFFSGPYKKLKNGTITLSAAVSGVAYTWCSIHPDSDRHGGIPNIGWLETGMIIEVDWKQAEENADAAKKAKPEGVYQRLQIYSRGIPAGSSVEIPLTSSWIGGIAFVEITGKCARHECSFAPHPKMGHGFCCNACVKRDGPTPHGPKCLQRAAVVLEGSADEACLLWRLQRIAPEAPTAPSVPSASSTARASNTSAPHVSQPTAAEVAPLSTAAAASAKVSESDVAAAAAATAAAATSSKAAVAATSAKATEGDAFASGGAGQQLVRENTLAMSASAFGPDQPLIGASTSGLPKKETSSLDMGAYLLPRSLSEQEAMQPWTCSRCTLENEATATVCAACDQPRHVEAPATVTTAPVAERRPRLEAAEEPPPLHTSAIGAASKPADWSAEDIAAGRRAVEAGPGDAFVKVQNFTAAAAPGVVAQSPDIHTELLAQCTTALQRATLAKLRVWEVGDADYPLDQVMEVTRWAEAKLLHASRPPSSREDAETPKEGVAKLCEDYCCGCGSKNVARLRGCIALTVITLLSLHFGLTLNAAVIHRAANAQPTGLLYAPEEYFGGGCPEDRGCGVSVSSGAAVSLHQITDWPKLSEEELRKAQDVVLKTAGDVFHFYRLASVSRLLGGNVRAEAEDGTVIDVSSDGRVALQSPWEPEVLVDTVPAAGEATWTNAGAFRKLVAATAASGRADAHRNALRSPEAAAKAAQADQAKAKEAPVSKEVLAQADQANLTR